MAAFLQHLLLLRNLTRALMSLSREKSWRADDGTLDLLDGGGILRLCQILKPVVLCTMEMCGKLMGDIDELVFHHPITVIVKGAWDHEPAYEI